jgi:hypothetical protein
MRQGSKYRSTGQDSHGRTARNRTEKPGQNMISKDSTAETERLGQDRLGRTARQDSRDRSSWTGQLDRIDETEQIRPGSQNMLTCTVQIGENSWDWIAVTGQPVQDSRNRKERT